MRLLSRNAARILARFLASPHAPLYGYEIMRDSRIKSGSLYPVLGRFERLGWIAGSTEAPVGGRPPRRVYTVVGDAIPEMNVALDRYCDAKGLAPHERQQLVSL